MREAIGLAMDFEWLNRQLFYNAYTRVRGFFVASDFEATGKPGADELALLEPLRSQNTPTWNCWTSSMATTSLRNPTTRRWRWLTSTRTWN